MKGDFKKNGMFCVDMSVMFVVTYLLFDSTMAYDRETTRLESVDSLISIPSAPPRAFRLKNPYFLMISL